MSTTTAFLKSGTLLNSGNYKIIDFLGQGGTGITYKAHETGLDRIVVLKELFYMGMSVREPGRSTIIAQTSASGDYEKRKRKFIQEGKILANLKHPNIVNVINLFEENNTVYLVLEYIDGRTISHHVKELGPLEEKVAIGILKPICSALEAVHAQRLLHRDITPSNIMLDRNLNPILIDFGIAKDLNSPAGVTNTTVMTHGYAPFEQYYSTGKLGPFTDIYGLCATSYFMLTGEKPISAAERVDKRLASPKRKQPTISSSLSSVIMKGMNMKSTKRHQTVKELLDELDTVKFPTRGRKPKKDQVLHQTDQTVFDLGSQQHQTDETVFEPSVRPSRSKKASAPVPKSKGPKPRSQKPRPKTDPYKNSSQTKKVGNKSKIIAGVIALMLGGLGVHRFYLRQGGVGLGYIGLFIFGIVIELPVFSSFLALVDAIAFFVMKKDDFDRKYNS